MHRNKTASPSSENVIVLFAGMAGTLLYDIQVDITVRFVILVMGVLRRVRSYHVARGAERVPNFGGLRF